MKKKKYPKGKSKLTGFVYPHDEGIGVGAGFNYGKKFGYNTKFTGDVSKYYKNLKLNQTFPISKKNYFDLNVGVETGNLNPQSIKYQGFKPKFNVGFKKTFPDGKGKEKKNVVYVPDEETLKREQQARIDSTNSYQESERLRAKIEQESADYEASIKKLGEMSDDEYLEKGDAVEAESDRINDNSRANAKRFLGAFQDEYNKKGIEASDYKPSPYLGKTMDFPVYSLPKTTVELKKEEKEKEKEKKEEEKEKEKKEEKSYTEKNTTLDDGTIMKRDGETIKSKPSFERRISKREFPTPPPTPAPKEEPKVDYRGKIKYISDGDGPTKYFFIDSLGRPKAITKAEAERRQAQDKTEIVEVMKNKKKKMPYGIKYNNGRKYVYNKGKKYADGLAGTISKGLGKANTYLDAASDVAGWFGQFGTSGNEKANKIAGIFNSANSFTNTLQGGVDKQIEKGNTNLSLFPYGRAPIAKKAKKGKKLKKKIKLL